MLDALVIVAVNIKIIWLRIDIVYLKMSLCLFRCVL